MTSLHPLKQEDMPSGWKLMPVGEVLVSSQYGTNASASESGSVSVVGMKDVDDGKVAVSDLAQIEMSDEELANYLLNKGDILINRTNSYDLVGKVGIFDSEASVAFASYLVRLRVNADVIKPEYLNYWLNGYIAQKTIKRIATKAVSQANINPTEFKKHCYVPVPQIEEQEKIVKLLSTYDAVVENIDKLIAVKQSQFEWLSNSLLDSNLGQDSKWEEYVLDDLFTERRETGREDLPLLSVTRKDGIIPREDVGRKDTSNIDKSKYLRICPGDIGYNTMRMWQGVSALSELEGIVSPAYTICTPSELVDGEFMAHLFKLPRVVHLFYRYSQGLTSDTWNLKFPHFKKIKIRIPTLVEQKEIAKVLTTSKEEIKLLREQAILFREQKRGLMQKLLTGVWRITDNAEAA